MDEVGKGALAGPLVVAAVAFPADAIKVRTVYRGPRGDRPLSAGDSKKVKNPAQRAALDLAIRESCASLAVVERSPAEIDARLMRAVFPETVRLAVARCLEKLVAANVGLLPREVLVLIDGDLERPDVPCPIRTMPGGDALDWRIGAASLVAKVYHDRCVDRLVESHPEWSFDKHRGYPTVTHKALLAAMGPLDGVHRRSFAPVRAARGPSPGMEEV